MRDAASPTCECPYWRWNHLPCKHMFAIMIHNSEWSELPGHFSSNPYFTLDKDVNNFVCPTTRKRKRSVGDDNESILDLNNLELQDDGLPSCHTGPKNTVKQLAVLLREKLSILRTHSYLCQDVCALEKTNDMVEEAVNFLSTKLELQKGIILEPEQKPKKRLKKTSTQKRKIKTKVLKIKQTKPKKRVGLKKEKYHYGITAEEEKVNSTELDDHDDNTSTTHHDSTTKDLHIIKKAKGKIILACLYDVQGELF